MVRGGVRLRDRVRVRVRVRDRVRVSPNPNTEPNPNPSAARHQVLSTVGAHEQVGAAARHLVRLGVRVRVGVRFLP